MAFSLYVDADSIPQKHRSIILRRALKSRIRCIFVADRVLPDVAEAIEADTAKAREPFRETLEKSELRKIRSCVSFVLVESHKDSADDYIAENAASDCLCITHDIPLCARVVEKGALALDDRGNLYDEKNVRERLSLRNAMTVLREGGVQAEKQKRFDQKTLEEFSNSFDRVLSRYSL